MKKTTMLLAVLLSACGGGGGDNPTAPAPAPAPGSVTLSFTPSMIDLTQVEGEHRSVTVTTKLSQPISEDVLVDIRLPNHFEQKAPTEKIDGQTFRTTLNSSTALTPGVQSGQITVKLYGCASGCANARELSAAQIPYRIQVSSSQGNLTPLQRLDGVSAWASRYGNGANSSYVPTTVKLNPASFNLRWKTTDTSFVSSPLIFNGHIIAHTGSKLEALREYDGTRIWSVTSNPTSADEPIVVGNRVFVPEYLGFDNAITSYEISTGQKFLSIPFVKEAPPQLHTDGESVYFDSIQNPGGQLRYQLTRTDPTTGVTRWQVQPDLGAAPRRVATDDQYAYAYMFNKLRVFRKSDGAEAFSVDHELGENSTSRRLTAMVDSSQRVIGGWYSWSHAYLSSFSIANKKQLWSVKDGFRSLPSLAHNMLYAVATQINSTERPSLQARSGDTGAITWSVLLPDKVDPNQDVMYEVVTVGDIIFVSSDRRVGGATYAVDRNTRQIVWTYPVTGKLGVSENGSLLIQSPSGNLLAFNLR
ncbi:MAG: PQQ-binding-like beta-propeller repeat protein [Acidovorax sp.]|uniref:outer membrane protein assembly factor BamB family protein n=1 Tax=Acidovorax sp. TaxID=1872122 RepID=UPI00391948A2